MSDIREPMSITQAAAYLGMPKAQLERWAVAGAGPAFSGHPLSPERMTFGVAELDAWRNRQAAA